MPHALQSGSGASVYRRSSVTHAATNSTQRTPKLQLKFDPEDVLAVMDILPRDRVLDLMENSGPGSKLAVQERILCACHLSPLAETCDRRVVGVPTICPQSAVLERKHWRCCSPIIRAGFTAGQTSGQGLLVTELHPTVGREGQQGTQVDRCVDISFVVHPAGRALPGWLTLEFRVYFAAVGAGLAGGIEAVC